MKIFNKIILISSFGLALLATPVFSANMAFDSKAKTFFRGEEFLVQVALNTESETINATEGEITYPTQILEIKEIQTGNSIINFWAEHPAVSENGDIRFSGITPGGYRGEKGLLFSIIFRAKATGGGQINVSGARTLKNDGMGTPASMTITPFPVSIAEGTAASEPIKTVDVSSPEGFTPEIAQDPMIFGGKHFLIFATQDKGRGIDHYEVREGWWGPFVRATSPYLLNNQKLDQKIYVKAIDINGNVRVETVTPSPLVDRYNILLILGILTMITVIILYFAKKYHEKNS